MTCPNCGKEFDQDISICPECGTPIGNATYTPVPKKKGKKRKIFTVLIIVLALLSGGGYLGYQYYLKIVKSECQKATEQIFSYAKEMDFSDVDPQYLPDELKENPNIKEMISDKVSEMLEDTTLEKILSEADVSINTDIICNEIVANASYEITNVTATYNSCDVTVTTKNKDYLDLASKLGTELQTLVVPDDSDSSFWQSLSDFFFGNDKKETDISNVISSKLLEYYSDCKDKAADVEMVGTISFGIKDGKWTLTNFDKKLIYNYYGLSVKDADSE